ncbi:MAG: hypothetical protein L0Y71_19720 [Gemmataceae bacterium]|nr:hypothetical protein [Gemmataceae bacterium]
MSAEVSFSVSLLITLAMTSAAACFLWRFVEPALSDYAGNRARGRCWAMVCSAFIVLLPLLVLTFDLDPSPAHRSWLFAVVARMRWPLLSMFIGTLMIAAIALSLHVPREAPMSRAEFDDRKRLLSKVETLRARELLSRLESTPAVNPKELDDLNRLVDKIQEVRPQRGGRGEAHSVN